METPATKIADKNRSRERFRAGRQLSVVMLGALLALGSSCGNVDPNEETEYLIYNYNPETDDYELEPAVITSLQDVRRADGRITVIRGGGRLVTASSEPESREDYEDLLQVEGDSPAQIEYTVDEDGTVVPWDFDSAMMLTVYHHTEQASQYFETVGVEFEADEDSESLGKIPIYYYPSIGIFGFKLPIPIFVDNAAYAFTLDAFLIPPRFTLSDAVPIFANRGVITHEYGHAVMNRLLYKDNRVPNHFLNEEEWTNTEINELGGLDEGIADIYAGLDTQDSNFIGHSISDTDLVDRDMAKVRYYDSAIAAEVTAGQFDVHLLGAVVASVLWALRDDVGDDTAYGKIIADTLRDMPNPTAGWRLAHFFNALYDHLPADVQPDACTLFVDRLPAIEDMLDCGSVLGGGPSLN